MGYAPTNQGSNLLALTFKVGPSAGMLPWRVVCLDTTATVGYGDASQASIKHPNTTFANGEKVFGVIIAPWALTTAPTNMWDAFSTIAQNKLATVRTHGVVPIMTDDTTDNTAINAGDFVRASTSTTSTGTSGILLAGTVAKGTLSTNAPAANQHTIGIALNKVNPTVEGGRFVMTLIGAQES